MQTIATAVGRPAVDAGNDADCRMSPVNGQTSAVQCVPGAPTRPVGINKGVGWHVA